MSIGKLTGVSIASMQALALSWDDGHTAMVDLSAIISNSKALAPLSKPTEFARAARLAPAARR